MSGDIEHIRRWRDGLAKEAAARGEKMFMGKPDAWFRDVHWFCPNGHVSGVFLGSETADLCLACHEPVLMGPAMGEAEFAPILADLNRVKIQFKKSE